MSDFTQAVAEAERAWQFKQEWDAAIAGALANGATIDDYLAVQAVIGKIKGVDAKSTVGGNGSREA